MKKKYHEIPICHTFGRECTVEFPRFQSCLAIDSIGCAVGC
jgi:hypothetical protein